MIIVKVPLAEELHARLKRFCFDKDFSMRRMIPLLLKEALDEVMPMRK